MNKLVITVGLPRSGKSTWAKGQAHNNPVVSPDAIRLALHGQVYIYEAEDYVWAIAKTMVRALFLAGNKKVILDATNITSKRRDVWKSKDWVRQFVVFVTPAEECIERAKESNRADLIPIIERMEGQYEEIGIDNELGAGEGFTKFFGEPKVEA